VRNINKLKICYLEANPSTPLSFRPSGEIFKGAMHIRPDKDSSLCSEWHLVFFWFSGSTLAQWIVKLMTLSTNSLSLT